MSDLQGKLALVTGAGPNIGREIARTLASAGATVLCNDVLPERAEATAQFIREQGLAAFAAPADVSDPEQVKALFEQIRSEHGLVDILVNNAAITIKKDLLTTSFEEWNKVVSITLTGAFLMSQAMASSLVEAGRKGAIVNIASTSGHRGRANAIAYCSAKAGVLNLTRSMAVELAKHGIRVNSVSPTKTGNSVGAISVARGRTYDEIPLGRMGNPEDQANAVLFLASDRSGFITGEDIRVDGGTLSTWGTRSKSQEEIAAGK